MGKAKNIMRTLLVVISLGVLLVCSRNPERVDGSKGVQLMSGSATWIAELKKLKNPAGIVPSGTSFSAANVIYKDPAVFNEFFVFDDNASLILLSANPVYFMRIDSRDFKFKLTNELAQINAGKTGTSKVLNSITYFKSVGDSQVEIYFTPSEMGYVTSGANKYRINDSNSTTAPDVDLYKLYDAAASASIYAPIFADQQLADDAYAHAQAGKRRLVITPSNYVASPQVINSTSVNLNFSAMIGTNLAITEDLLGAQDINFIDRFAVQRDFGAFFSLPIGNSRAAGRNCLAQFDGIVVVIRGDMSPFKSFMSSQGVNMDATPVKATKNVVAPLSAPFCTYIAPADVVINEVAPAIATGGDDLVELYVVKSTSLEGMKIFDGSTLRKTLPNVNVTAGDYIVIHFDATGTDETLSKTQAGEAGNVPTAWDFWNGDAAGAQGLQGTDGGVVLKAANGDVIDGVLYGNYSNSWTGSSTTANSAIFAAGRWKTAGDAFVESDAVNSYPSSIAPAESFQRKTDGYIANVSNSDWMVAPLTIGTANSGYVQTQTVAAAATDANHFILIMNKPITFASASSFTIAGLTISEAQFSTTYGTQTLITMTTSTQAIGPYQVVITSPNNVLDFYGTAVSGTNPSDRATFNGFQNLTSANVVISEVQLSGATTLDEFVELYNPTGAGILLTGWRLRKKTSGSPTTTIYYTFIATSCAGGTAPCTIPANGYLLIAGSGYTGTEAADVTGVAVGISGDNVLILDTGGAGALVDVVAWGAITTNTWTTGPALNAPGFINSNQANPDDYQSIERKNNPNATATSLGAAGVDEVKGNGWDSGINSIDFIFRPTAKPQNSTRTETPSL